MITQARRVVGKTLPVGLTALLLASVGLQAAAGASGRIIRATGSTTTATGTPTDPWNWTGTPSKGYLPKGEPAVHGGQVKIGMITAGTIHDGGYYQSEATAITAASKKFHWATPIIEGGVAATTALSAAENLCSEGVDLLVIGETQLNTAAPAAASTSCKDTPVWIYGSTGTVTATPRVDSFLSISETTEAPQSFATGAAMGLWLKAHHQTKAGFITGPAVTFTEQPAKAYLAGMRYVLKKATLVAVYTGTFTKSGPAITAATSMISEGIKLIYPFLGASLLPTGKYISKHGGATLSGGGRWCDHQGEKFAIQQVYNPGYQLAPALTAFDHGKLRVGVTRTFVLGKTSVPAVAFCPSAGVGSSGSAALKAIMKKLATGTITAAALITKTAAPQ